ncbi:MAG TPA: hypothetical protein VKM55_24850 [Candidatus Lokiarchaeia archaeon]|nr:hypothetical protein [Candidatus Lokiarchaeia archaeon]
MTGKNEKSAWMKTLSPEAINFTAPTIMVKLLGTIDPEDYPHVTLIACNKAVASDTIKWGQFTQGTSKRNVLERPKQGAFYMTTKAPYKFMQAKMDLDRCSVEGADAADFNAESLFRYNTYVRVYKIYFNKIKAVSPIRDLSPIGILNGAIVDGIGKNGMKTGIMEKRLPLAGASLFNGALNPKFACWLDPADGYPIIVPCFQARAIERKSIVFPLTQFKQDLAVLETGAKAAFFALDTELRSLLVKGKFLGFKKSSGISFGQVDIETVYNTMPPVPGVVYPALEIRPKVEQF